MMHGFVTWLNPTAYSYIRFCHTKECFDIQFPVSPKGFTNKGTFAIRMCFITQTLHNSIEQP